MPGDPFYSSSKWRALRALALRRDDFTCTVPGCGRPATIVDHIIRRRDGGGNTLTNLRSLCVTHDNQIKERPKGYRSNKGELSLKGVDANGRPLDPKHPWNTR